MFGRRTFRQLAIARRGVVAIEFAFIGTALLGMVIGVCHIAFNLYAQSVLDFAGASLARTFQTGTVRNIADINDASFRTLSICPALHNLLDCSAVIVTTYPVVDYTAQSSSVKYNPGGPKSLMVVKLTYTSWIPSWPVLNGLGSGKADPMKITSRIPYVNEFAD